MFLRKTPPDHQPFFKVHFNPFADKVHHPLQHFFSQEEGDAIGALRRLRKSLAVTFVLHIAWSAAALITLFTFPDTSLQHSV